MYVIVNIFGGDEEFFFQIGCNIWIFIDGVFEDDFFFIIYFFFDVVMFFILLLVVDVVFVVIGRGDGYFKEVGVN